MSETPSGQVTIGSDVIITKLRRALEEAHWAAMLSEARAEQAEAELARMKSNAGKKNS